MYPGLLPPLLVLVALCVAGVSFLVVRQPVSRRLAARQLTRRRTEALLVVSGSVLGTAIIIGALVVGDTPNHSVRQEAYRTLGPIDERVVAATPQIGAQAAAPLAPLPASPALAGVFPAL